MSVSEDLPGAPAGPPPLPPPPPPAVQEAPSGVWNRPEDVYPARRETPAIGRAAPGHFTIHPEDWESPIFRNAVVPEEDNPLRGLRRVGADLLHPELWPALARINPVLAYLTARRRGATTEDWMGCVPWIVVGAFNAWVFLAAPGGAAFLVGAIMLELAVLPVLLAACTGCVVGMHIRHSLRAFPFEELMTTPLRPENIVQGLTVRPMAVQAAVGLFFILLHVPLIILAEIRVAGTPGLFGFLYAMLYLPLLTMLLKAAVELGGALGARAHFCIRDAGTATVRTFVDLALVLVVRVCVPAVVLAVVVHVALLGGIAAPLFLLLFAGLLGFGVLAIPVWLYGRLREDAVGAMQWTCDHPEEWWVNELNEHGRYVRERDVLTRWSHMVELLPRGRPR